MANIAVIGAGPKGVALAAKAYCLRQAERDIQVTLFDRHEIGAFWTGGHGYTDGAQRLCTPAERDLGFPYSHAIDGDGVAAELMQSLFSWQAFLVSPETGGSGRYSAWVNHGRKPPLHSDFADYLKFAANRAQADPIPGEVRAVLVEDDRWTLQVERAGQTMAYPGFDGLVVTGPGPAKTLSGSPKDPRLFDGVNFWTRARQREAAIQSLGDRPVVIVGGGGTAAAVTAWFLRHGHRSTRIIVLNSQAMLFTRTTNFFESSRFDDEDTWQALDPNTRRAFTARLNRGVVWDTITDLLADAESLLLQPGRATRIELGEAGTDDPQPPLVVRYRNALLDDADDDLALEAGLVVDTTGFDPWAFVRWLPDEVRGQMGVDQRMALLDGMGRDLSFDLARVPKLHAPNLSDIVGPGYQSLMVLGAMADRILQPYL